MSSRWPSPSRSRNDAVRATVPGIPRRGSGPFGCGVREDGVRAGRLAVASLVVVASVAVGVVAAPTPASAQEPTGGAAGSPEARVEAARRLAESGAIEAATDTLRAYLAEYPEDGGTHWLLARYLYRAGRAVEAARAYEDALVRLPGDPWLRLEYAERLLAMGEAEHVVGVLGPTLSEGAPPAVRARALTLAGTAAYWRGDLGAAARRFRTALAVDSGQAEARRQLAEIRALTRSWLSVGATVLDDNQPYRRYRGTLEGGTYLTPSWSLAVGLVPRLLDVPPAPAAEGIRTAAAVGWAELTGRIPAHRLGLRVRFGGWWADGVDDGSPPPQPGRGPPGTGSNGEGEATWLGAAELSLKLPLGLTFRADASRDRYLSTTSAVDTLVVVRTLEAALDRAAAPGWAGEAVARAELFPDDNVVTTAYAWLLAPVLPAIRVGWASSWQDAEESRWSLGGLEEPRYAPYYTPERIAVHSVLGEVLVGGGPVEVRASGRYGVWAREQEPLIVVDDVGGSASAALMANNFREREFTPWEARIEITAAPPNLPVVRVAASREATAFWTQSRLELRATYRLPARSLP